MPVLAAIAIFPILTLLLVGLSKAENVLSGAASFTGQRSPVEPAAGNEIPRD